MQKKKSLQGREKITISNVLTVLRIIFIPYFIIFLFSNYKYGKLIALLVFIVASLTDLYDGKLARQRGEVTEFGKFMDPLADKLLVLSAFFSFVQLDLVPFWMVLIIFSRELIITSMRLVGAQKGTVIAAEQAGKHKTAWHIATIITILVIIAFQDYITRFIHPWEDFFIMQGDAGEKFVAFVHSVPWVMTFICVLWSVYSGWDFFKRNRHILTEIGL